MRPVLFTGDQTPRERDNAKQKFALDDHCRLFLSSDAGGVGLDLPEASYLVNYNLPWSAGKFDQRQARIIRLSSEWESVTLVTMVMAGSIEERMYDMLMAKRAIAEAVVDGRGIDAKGRLKLDVATLTDFLTHSEV
jgi:SNF2 family DNA or RNA helicase